MILQWGLSSYRSHDILIWVMIIFAAVMAFFLLMEFFNTRKSYHLMWGSALILTFIAFHQVANTGSYTWLLESWGTGIMILIPGLIAAGILLATFEDKQLIGQIYLLCMIIIAITSMIIGLQYVQSSLEIENWLRYLILAGASLISLGVMLVVPLYTTLISKETTKKALMTSGAAALLIIWVIALVFAMTYVETFIAQFEISYFPNQIENIMLYWVLGLFPYFFIFSMTFTVLGIHYEPKWKFSIPGVDVEDEARKDKLIFQESNTLIISAAGIAGGVILLLGGVLAAWVWGSQTIIMAVTVGILMIGGLIGALVGFAVLIGWEPEISGRKISNYLRIALGLVTLIFAIILLFLPSTPAAVFLTAEGGIWGILNLILIFIGAILILAGGILSEFIIKE